MTSSPANAPDTQKPTGGRPVLATLVFTGGAAFPRALSLLMLPVYAAALTPAEYGELSVLLLLGIAISQVLPLGLDLAVFRTYFRSGFASSQRASYVNALWLLVAGTAIVGGLAFAGLGFALLGATGYLDPDDYLIAVLAYALYAVAAPIPFALLRAEQRLRSFGALTVVSALVTTGSIVLAVSVLDAGVSGWLWATATANAATLALACLLVPFRWPAAFEKKLVIESVRLGTAIVPHYLSHWAMLGANRFVLAAVVPSASVGIFSLAANLALPAHIVGQALNQALTPRYALAIDDDDALRGLPRLMAIQAGTVIGACAVLALVLPPLVPLLLPESYRGAADLVGWILLGYTLLGLYYVPMTVATVMIGATRWTWTFPLGSAAGSLALLAVVASEENLIPAAATVAAGYGALLLGIGLYAARTHQQPRFRGLIPWTQIAALGLFGAAVYGCGVLLAGDYSWHDLGVRIGYLAVLALLGLVAYRASGAARR